MILDNEQQRQIIARALAGLTIGQLGPNSGVVAATLAAVQAAEITPQAGAMPPAAAPDD